MSNSRTVGDSPVNSSVVSNENNKSVWHVFGKKLVRKEIVFFTQIILIYVVIITCLVNLTVYREHNRRAQLWIALLSGCLGYALPNPSLDSS